jgi:putative ABC transport system ATP-binding protein
LSRKPIIKAKKISKTFHTGDKLLVAVNEVDLEIYSGDFVLILGPSGCGKSTLLHMLLGLETPSYGKVFLRGEDIYALKDDEKADMRKQKFGVVYQQSHFVKSLNVAENVAFPLFLDGRDEKSALERAKDALTLVKMEKYFYSKPVDLSGGEQQKVSLARSLVLAPWILICDEPTGNLDSKSGWEIMDLLNEINKKSKRTIIMVTHNMTYWPMGNRKILMEDGKVVGSYGEKIPKNVLDKMLTRDMMTIESLKK